jgi:LPS export ABC transporter permease LptF/LPS export ABC transporter permease LptG
MSSALAAITRIRPATILWRHVILELMAPTVLAFSVFTFLFLMRFLLRISRLWIVYGAELGDVLWMVVYSLPHIMVLTIPMGLLVGSLIAFGRMSADFEIVALRAAGVSLLHLLPPVLIAAGVLWAATSWVYMVMMPWGNTSIREMEWQTITQQAFSNEVKPRVFNDDFPDLVLYIEDVVDQGSEWRGVFAARTDSNPPTILRAERAYPIIDEELRRTYLRMSNGIVIAAQDNPADVTVTAFENRTELVWSEAEDSLLGNIGKDGRSMTLPELRAAIEARQSAGDPAWDLRVEVHKKYAFPFACLVMGVIALPLGISTQRQTTAAGFAIGTGVIVVYYFFAQNGEQQADAGHIEPWIGMWAGNIVLGIAALLLLWKKSREIDFGIWRRTEPVVSQAWELVRSWYSRRFLHRPSQRRRRQRGAGFPRTLDRLVLRSYLSIYLLTFLAFVVVFAMGTWIDKASYVKNPSLIPDFLGYYVWEIVFDVTPMAAVVTVLAVFSLMAKRGEIVAALAGGVSLYRLMAPILVPALALTGAQYALQEYVLPYTTQQAKLVDEEMHPTDVKTLQEERTWVFSEGGVVFHFAEFVEDPPQFLDLRIYYLDQQSSIARIEFADIAEWRDDEWRARDGWRRFFVEDEESIRPTPLEEFSFAVLDHIDRSPEYFQENELLPEQMTMTQLRRHIDILEQQGYETHRAMVDFHMKVATPSIVFVMTLVGVPFAFRMGRHGALTGVAVAIALVAVYWIAFGVFQAFGYAGQLPPILAAWAPHLLFTSLGLHQALGVRT